MRIGDTIVHPEMEIELSEPKPYDWKNDPAPPPKPYKSEFKIETPAKGQEEPEEPQKPRPFSFGFMSMAKDGSQTRQEQQDESGKVTGSYSTIDANGISRSVAVLIAFLFNNLWITMLMIAGSMPRSGQTSQGLRKAHWVVPPSPSCNAVPNWSQAIFFLVSLNPNNKTYRRYSSNHHIHNI